MLKRDRAASASIARKCARMLARLLPPQVELVIGTLDERGIAGTDPAAVERILATLCAHARDLMPNGGSMRIDCRNTFLDSGYLLSHPWLTPGAYLCVSLSATGAVCDAESRPQAPEPLASTSELRRTQPKVAMLHALVEEEGGMVHFSSVAGQGCVARLYFPLVDGPSAACSEERKM